MKPYKKWSATVLFITLTMLALLISLNYIVDPLQFYRKAAYQSSFSTQQRYQNPGLAKNYDYDTIIIGTSMTENFLPSYVNEKLGVKALKLSMSGATAKEQYMIAKLAIETGKVKNIIWGVDYFALRGEPDRVRDEYGPFPHYFYDHNPFNDLRYLLNLDTTAETMETVESIAGMKKRENTDLNMLNTWTHYAFGKQKVLAEWEKVMGGGTFTTSEYEFANIKQNLNENLISLIQAHPNIQFHLFYPPYSILQHRFFHDKSRALFENELEAKKYLFEKVGSLPHVSIYDFQQERSITFDLTQYKDLAHHSPKINEYIIDAIAKDEHRVDGTNIDGLLEQLRQQVETVKINQL